MEIVTRKEHYGGTGKKERKILDKVESGGFEEDTRDKTSMVGARHEESWEK